MENNYFRQSIDAMKNNENYKLTTFDRQAVIYAIDKLIQQLKVTKAGISYVSGNYSAKRHVAEWLFMDSRKLDNIIKTLTSGGYDND